MHLTPVSAAALIFVFIVLGVLIGLLIERWRWTRLAGSARFITVDSTAYHVDEILCDGSIEKNIMRATSWVHQPTVAPLELQFSAHVMGDLTRLMVKFNADGRRLLSYVILNRKAPAAAYAEAVEGLANNMRDQIAQHEASKTKRKTGPIQ